MQARFSKPTDINELWLLAHMSCQENGSVAAFDAQRTVWTFGGAARNDPAVIVLEDASEPVGFLLATVVAEPFTTRKMLQCARAFIRPDKRKADAHGQLMDAFLTLAGLVQLPADEVTNLDALKAASSERPVDEVKPAPPDVALH